MWYLIVSIPDLCTLTYLENCKTIIIAVGGNDADNGVDLDDFLDNYIDLLDYLASDDRQLIVSGLHPRTLQQKTTSVMC